MAVSSYDLRVCNAYTAFYEQRCHRHIEVLCFIDDSAYHTSH